VNGGFGAKVAKVHCGCLSVRISVNVLPASMRYAVAVLHEVELNVDSPVQMFSLSPMSLMVTSAALAFNSHASVLRLS